MDKKWLNIAVVGTGSIYNDAHRHAFVSKATDNFVLVALCDLNRDLAEAQKKWIERKYTKMEKKARKSNPDFAEALRFALDNLKVYNDYDKMLSEMEGVVDIVDNCTHGREHIPLSIKAMEHGMHAMAEKPPGTNWWDVKRIVEAEKKTGKYYQLNENVCYEKNTLKMREVAQSGVLGKVEEMVVKFGHGGPYDPYYHAENGLPHFIDPVLAGGGCLQDLAPHGISKFFWPLYVEGAHVVSCKTNVLERRVNPRMMSGKPYESPVDDWAEADLEIYDPKTDSTYVLHNYTNWCGGFSEPSYIKGEKGILTIDRFPKLKGGGYGPVFKPTGATSEKENIYYDTPSDKYDPHKSHVRQIQIFVDNILAGKPSLTPGTYALRLQEILSMHYFSKMRGKKVTFEEMEEWGKEMEAKYGDPQETVDAISKEFAKAIDLK